MAYVKVNLELLNPDALQQNFIYVFLEKELRGLSHKFHTVVSVSDLYIPRIGPDIFLQAEYSDRLWEYINRSQTHECGNWDEGHAFPFLGIFVSHFWYCVFAVCDRCADLQPVVREHAS
jgi:hypothetical protein